MQKFTNIMTAAIDFVLPKRCPPCGAILQGQGDFCATCWQQLSFLGPPWCSSCALPMPAGSTDDIQCAICIGTPPRHDGIRAVTAYDDVSRQIVLKLKHGGKIGLAALIASHMSRHLPVAEGVILIAPVPLHWTRLWSRGYNQSALIAQALVRQASLKEGSFRYVPDLLIRKVRTPLLRGMSGKQRRKTVGKVFTLNPKRKNQIKGARIILIDDVLTSGATSDACIAQLKRGGVGWIQLFCWARVLRGEAAENNSYGLDGYLLDSY